MLVFAFVDSEYDVGFFKLKVVDPKLVQGAFVSR